MPDCVRCYETKPERHFYRRKDCAGFLSACKQCHRAYQARRRLEFPEYGRTRYLKKYGLTLEDYMRILRAQKGVCAMCGKGQKRALSVDHHHDSGRVRELLCGSCNALLGLAKENKTILLAAIAYLDKHSNRG